MQLATQQLQLQNGVLHVNFFLATCNETFVALQVARKIASCNMAKTVPVKEHLDYNFFGRYGIDL